MDDGPIENEKIDEETKRIENTDSETTPFITAETAEVTGEEHLERNTMNDVVGMEETTNETGERHCGCPVLRTLSSMKRTKAWMKTKKQRNQGEVRAHPRSVVAVVIARESNVEHSDRITRKFEADRIKAEGHHVWYPHLVAEEGSIVLHVSNNMNGGKKDVKTVKTVKKKVRQQQQKRLKRFQEKTRKSEDSSRRGEVHPKRKTMTERSEQMHQKCIRDKNRVIRQQDIQRILEDFKRAKNSSSSR